MNDALLRQGIIAACVEMNRAGLNQGTSGNVSVRAGAGLLITPSGVGYGELMPDDIVAMDMNGSYRQALAPSSEWRIHRDLLQARPELNAVVHVHPTYCTALAIHGMEIPAVHYMIAAAGGSTIRCAPYATFGTQELSDHVLRAMEDRSACLLANHGMVAAGPNLAKTMWVALEVETLARQFFHALLLGAPNVLPDDEIGRVVEKFASYGPRTEP